MVDKKITEKESLEIISRMIKNTQDNLEKGSGMPFLVWGYTTLIVTIIIGLCYMHTIDHRWNCFWFLIPIVGWTYTIRLIKNDVRKVKTYVDVAVEKLWFTIGVAQLVIMLCAFMIKIPVLFFVLLILGIGIAVTGLITEFKPLAIGGFIAIFLSVPLLWFSREFYGLIIFGLAVIVTMIIPGHILVHRAKKQSNA